MTTPLSIYSILAGRFAGVVLLMVAGLGLFSGRARGESFPIEEYSVKAALMFNFAKYTEWPGEAFPRADAPIVIGVLGSDPFGAILDRVVEGKSISGRRLVIRRASGLAPLDGAHFVFVSASYPQARQDCATLERGGALTFGDSAYTAQYTAVNFAIEGEKIVFTVDLERAQRAGAKISSRLLKFARSVRRVESAGER